MDTGGIRKMEGMNFIFRIQRAMAPIAPVRNTPESTGEGVFSSYHEEVYCE